MSETQAAPQTPPAVLPPMPEDAQLILEGKMRFVPDRRVLEKAPALLRHAAIILAVGSLLPWLGHGGSWLSFGLAKAVAGLAALCFYAAVLSRTKDPVPAGLGALAKPRWGRPYAWKPKGLAETLAHAIPTPLHLLALLLTVLAVLLPFFDPGVQASLDAGSTTASAGRAAAEIGLLLVGLLTLVHVYAYERGGDFNPLYAFMFLAPLMLGVPAIMNPPTVPPAIGLIGGLVAVGAGAYAVYTIVVAMLEAKKQGDAKKAAALEARRAARKGGA